MKTELESLFNDLADYYDKPPPSETAVTLLHGALSRFPFEVIVKAAQAHISDPQAGKWMPRAADIVAQIEKASSAQRLGPDEAWSIALKAEDERATVVWTDEIAKAWFLAQPILEEGDKTGARMAFKQAYERATYRKTEPPKIQVSVGWDPNQRKEAFEEAEMKGLLTSAQASSLLLTHCREEVDGPAPEVAGLLVGKKVSQKAAEESPQLLAAIKDGIASTKKDTQTIEQNIGATPPESDAEAR